MENQITVTNPGENAQIQLSQGLLNARESALAGASLVGEIETAADLEAAAQSLGEMKALEKTVEKAHKEAKAPFLALTKRLDALKREYIASLEPEINRISRLVGDHQDRERRKAEEAKRKAEEERQRIAEEQLRREEAIRAEASKALMETGDLPEGYQEKLDAAREEAKEARAAVRIEKEAAATLTKSAGVRRMWKYEVTDIHALAAVRPELVRMEPNGSAIMAVIRSTEGQISLPGLKVWSEAWGTVRVVAKTTAEIEDNDY